MAFLEVVYKFRNQAKAEVNSTKKQIEGIGKSTDDWRKKNADFLKGMAVVGAGVGAAYMVMKQGWDAYVQALNRGVEIAETRRQFEALAKDIGTTSDMLEFKMTRATNATRSSVELMNGALELMKLGFADNEDEAVRLSRVVGALDMDMNQLSLTLSNKTTMRFDSLGVAVDGFDEKLQGLIDSGMDADAAFQEAFLQQAEEQIERVGDAAQASAGDLATWGAVWEDQKDALNETVSIMSGPLLGAYANQSRAMKISKQAMELGIITQEDWNDVMDEGGIGLDRWENILGALNQRLDSHDKIIANAARHHEIMTGAVENNAKEIDYSNDVMEEQVKLLYGTEKATRMYARTFLETSDIISDGARALGTEYTKAIEDSEDALYSWNQTMVYSGGLTGQQRTNLSELNSEQKKIEENIRSLTGGTAGLGLTTEELNDKLKKEYERLDLVTAAMGPLMSITGEASIASEGYAINTEAVNSTFRQMVIDGGASAETVALMDVALGGYDETAIVAALNSAILSEKLGQLAEDFAGGKISAEEMQEKLQEIVNDSPYVTEAEFLNDAARQGITDIIKALDKIPRSITTKHNVTSSGSPSFPSGGGADSGSSASEGAAGGRSGVTVVGNVNITNPPTNTTTAERIGGAIQ